MSWSTINKAEALGCLEDYRMRKAVTLIMIGTMILISIVMPAISESSIRYSEDAVKQCCDIWNDYYAQYHLFLDCGFNKIF